MESNSTTEPQISEAEAQKLQQQQQQLIQQQATIHPKSATKADWLAVSESALRNYETIVKDPNWKEFASTPCKKWELNLGDRIASRGELVIQGYTIEQIWEFINNPDNIKLMDPMCENYKTVEREGDYELSWMKFKGIWPVAARDFLMLIYMKVEPDRCFMICKSINHEYPLEKGVVRAHCELGAYVLEKLGEKKVKVTYISDTDVKGMIPGMIKKQVSKMQAEVPANILKAIQTKKNKK